MKIYNGIKCIKTEEEARQYAINYQRFMSDNNLSYGEIAHFTNKLTVLAEKFGLKKEFEENGII